MFSTVFLSSCFGYLASQVPVALRLVEDRLTHRRELEAKTYDLACMKQGFDLARAQVQQADTTIESLKQDTDCAALRCLRASVRPTLTYGFFGLFVLVKLVAFRYGMQEHVPVGALLPLLWDVDSASLLAAVMAFWFGSRTVSAAVAQRGPLHTPIGLTGSGVVGNRIPIIGE